MTKLHLGCGSINLPGWVNIDFDSPSADIVHDLRKPLPFDDHSADFIFAEHFIEHVTYEEARGLLGECRRVLKEDGVLRFTTPDLMHLVRAYLSGDVTGWGDLWQPGDPCELLNQAFRFWGHQYVYDYSAAKKLVLAAGFKACKRVEWRDSGIGALKNLESRPFNGEIIVEAYVTQRVDAPYEAEGVEYPQGLGSALDARANAALKAQTEAISALTAEVRELRSNEAYIQDLRRHISNQEEALTRQAEVIAHLQSLGHPGASGSGSP